MNTATATRITDLDWPAIKAIRGARIDGTLVVTFRKGDGYSTNYRRYSVYAQAPDGPLVYVGWVVGSAPWQPESWSAYRLNPTDRYRGIEVNPQSCRRHAADEIIWSATR